MISSRRHSSLLPASLAAICVALALHVTGVQSQSGGGIQSIVMVEGRPAVGREVLVQFADVSVAASNQRALGDQVDAVENVPVGRQGLRRFRSRVHNVEALMEFFRGQPGVVLVEPNYIVAAAVTPNDPLFSSLWGLLNTGQTIFGVPGIAGADIDAPSAWDVSTGSTANVVAVIDSGIDYTHPDLVDNVWSAPTAFTVTIGGIPIDCPAGSHGFNAITRSCDPMDNNGHGTHVSGTVGARGNNGIGVTGVNWTASIIGAKFLDASGLGSTSNAINSIDFLIQTKAFFAGTGGANIRVLNNSWGGGGFSTSLRNMIINAQAAGMLFVAAAGNGGADQIGDDNDVFPFYPSSYDVPNIIAVAASNNQDNLGSFSNFGLTRVHLAAPGVSIRSTTIGGGTGFSNGTSMASPHVAGAAALVLSECALDTAGLKDALLTSVDAVPALTGRMTTGGRLNVNRAIRSCGGGPPEIPLPPTGLAAIAGDGEVDLTWNASAGATSYRVKRSTASGGPFVQIAEVPGNSFNDSTVVNETTYFYVVSAVNSAGESSDSSSVSATPTAAPGVPAPPTGVTAETGPSAGQIVISWNASPGAANYKVQRSKKTGGPYGSRKNVNGVTITQSGLVSGKRYFYVVTARNAFGESGPSEEVSAVAR